jgi:hypothetical protein
MAIKGFAAPVTLVCTALMLSACVGQGHAMCYRKPCPLDNSVGGGLGKGIGEDPSRGMRNHVIAPNYRPDNTIGGGLGQQMSSSSMLNKQPAPTGAAQEWRRVTDPAATTGNDYWQTRMKNERKSDDLSHRELYKPLP